MNRFLCLMKSTAKRGFSEASLCSDSGLLSISPIWGIFKFSRFAKNQVMRYQMFIRFLFALGITACGTSAFADQFYFTAELKCDSSKSELVISFAGTWNEPDKVSVANLGASRIDPSRLVEFSQDSSRKYSIRTKKTHRACRIGKDAYDIEISPTMSPRFHPEGFCATRIGAKVTVRLLGKVVATAENDACTESGMVTTVLTVKPGNKPTYEMVNARDFYGM